MHPKSLTPKGNRAGRVRPCRNRQRRCAQAAGTGDDLWTHWCFAAISVIQSPIEKTEILSDSFI